MCWRCAKLSHCPVTHHKMRNTQLWYLDEEQIQNYVLHQTALLHTASQAAKKQARADVPSHAIKPTFHCYRLFFSSNLSPTLQDSSTCHPHYRACLLVTHATGLIYLSPTPHASSNPAKLSPTLQDSSTCHPHYRTHLLVTHTTRFIQSSQTVTHTTGLFYLSPTQQDSSTCHPHHRVHPIQPTCHRWH